jgi:hypothetical protein
MLVVPMLLYDLVVFYFYVRLKVLHPLSYGAEGSIASALTMTVLTLDSAGLNSTHRCWGGGGGGAG